MSILPGMELPKYARPEIERRWLASGLDVRELPGRGYELLDHYLTGTRMRLRKLVDCESGKVTYKLAKKYGAQYEDGVRWEPIVNIYLSAGEYSLFAAFPHFGLRKRRHLLEITEITYGVDILESGLVMVEAEFPSIGAAREAKPPPFADAEITGNPEYEGARLARGGQR